MRPRLVYAVIIIVCLAVPSCNGSGSSHSSQRSSDEAPQEVTGPVVDIEAGGVADVQAFTVKSGDRIFQIFVDHQVDYGFPLSHLNAHRLSGEPVRVELAERDGKLYALSIVDA